MAGKIHLLSCLPDFFFLCSIRIIFPFTPPFKSPTLCSNMDALVMADSSPCTLVMNRSAKMASLDICVFSGRYSWPN